MSHRTICSALFICLLLPSGVLAQLPLSETSSKNCVIVMMTDGRSLQGEFEEGQFMLLRVNQDERRVAIGGIAWLFGSESKTTRIIGSPGMISGKMKDLPLRIKTTTGEQMISPQDIAFLCHFPCSEGSNHLLLVESEDQNTGTLQIVTFGVPAPAPIDVVSVEIFPSNWKGQVRLSNPRYPKVISSGVPFTLSLDIEGDNTLYRDLTKKALEKEASERVAQTSPLRSAALSLRLTYRLGHKKPLGAGQFAPYISTQYIPLYEYAKRGVLPNEVVRNRSVPIELTMGDQSENGPFGVYEGKGTAYLYMAVANEKYAQGRVDVAGSVSNVLRIDLEFEERNPASLPPK